MPTPTQRCVRARTNQQEFGGDLKETNRMSKVIQKHNRQVEGATSGAAPSGGKATTPSSGAVRGAVTVGDVDLELAGGGGSGGGGGGGKRVVRRGNKARKTPRQAGMAAVAANRAKRRVVRRKQGDAATPGRKAGGRSKLPAHRGPRRPPSQRAMHVDEDGDDYDDASGAQPAAHGREARAGGGGGGGGQSRGGNHPRRQPPGHEAEPHSDDDLYDD